MPQLYSILAIIAVNYIAYFRTQLFDLIVDDHAWYKFMSEERLAWKEKKKRTIRGYILGVKHLLYGGATFGPNKVVDHLFSIFLHTLTCVLIYKAFGTNNISLCAAALYAVNPINNQSAIWLNGRRFAVNTILVLLMMIFAPWGILFYFPTMVLQVTAIFSPILLAGKYPWFILAIPLALGIGWKFIDGKINYRKKLINDADRLVFTPKRFIVITKYYGHYFFKMMLPGWCGFIYPTLHYWGQTEKGNKDAYSFNFYFFKGICALAISGLGFMFIPLSFVPYLAFMILATLQWCAIIPVIHDLADRYVSLANVFMMFFVSYLANTYLGQFALPALFALATYYMVWLNNLMPMYENMPAHWAYHRYYSPGIPSPRKYEISHFIKAKDIMKAWMLIREGLDYNPTEYILLKQGAICQRYFGNVEISRNMAELASKNHYLHTKETEEKDLQTFLEQTKDLPPVITPAMQRATVTPVSRQTRRAEERKKAKNG